MTELEARIEDQHHQIRMAFAVIGGIAFGIWQTSWAAGIAAAAFGLLWAFASIPHANDVSVD